MPELRRPDLADPKAFRRWTDGPRGTAAVERDRVPHRVYW